MIITNAIRFATERARAGQDTVRIQCGYSKEEEEEAEEEEEEERRGKMFKEEEQNWIKKNVLWRRKEVEEGNI